MTFADRVAAVERRVLAARARAKAWREANPERYRKHKAAEQERIRLARESKPKKERPPAKSGAEKTAAYRVRHPERVAIATAISRARRRARERSAEGRFTAADVIHQLNEQRGKCFYCEQPLTKYHLDHKVPLARGGTNWPSNIVVACPPCNQHKGAKTADEFLGVHR